MDFIEELKKDEYKFLSEDSRLNNNICLLAVSGSYSYGTNTPDSDLDIRAIALNSKKEILLGKDFETIADTNTDTTVYSFNKMLKLLTNCNPNMIELLGLRPEHYLKLSPVGKLLLDNYEIFLSKKAISTFGDYANAQLRRLDNKAGRIGDAHNYMEHLMRSLTQVKTNCLESLHAFSESDIFEFEVSPSDELLVNINITDYPFEDFSKLTSQLINTKSSYNKVGAKNAKPIMHNKIGKHMMHLVRLFYMCLDILENKRIVTYREKEHDQLMFIRNNGMIDENGQPTIIFWELLQQLDLDLDYAAKHTELPDAPDYKRIEELKMEVNENIIKGRYV